MAQSSSSPTGPSDAQQELKDFWPNVTNDIRNLTANDLRTQELPLARIKKIMKLDEDVKMISAEAPVLFAKAAEIFIHELTLRAWIHTEDNKRRTLQGLVHFSNIFNLMATEVTNFELKRLRIKDHYGYKDWSEIKVHSLITMPTVLAINQIRNDIAMAITKYDQFDFLIDIVPRDELKPPKKEETKTTTVLGAEQVQYYLQLAQQHQAALQQAAGGGVQIVQQAVPGGMQTIQLLQSNQGGQTVVQQAPQIISQPTHQQAVLQLQGTQFQQPQQQSGGIQLVQQVVGPNGEVQTIPLQLTASQLQMLRMQLQAGSATANQQQPIILQTAPMQQTATVMTTAQNGAQILHS